MKNHRNKKLFALLFAPAAALTDVLLRKLAVIPIRSLPIDSYWYRRLAIQIICVVIACVLMFAAKKTFILCEKGRPFLTWWIPATVIMLYSALRAAGGFLLTKAPLRPLPEILACCVTVLLVGVSEEIVHRGVILNQLTAAFGNDTMKGRLISVFTGGTIFGLIHLFNILSGVEPLSAIVQALGAAGMGWLLGALYLRCRNIRVMALIHGLFDLCGLVTSGFFDTGETVESTISSASDVLHADLLSALLSEAVLLVLLAAASAVMLRNSAMQIPAQGEA
ncbi:MAG: CPBP family intramembrane metalloprotease [Oscillospiraceae bacterium]|nr:CPBP family intramembrane metalloprotease [Oscillospiraceae bacterium]